MNWFLIALVTPVTAAFVNHFDKYLISKYTKESSVGSLILFSSLFAIVTLPVLLVIQPDILSTIPWIKALVLAVNGGLVMLAILFYLYALEIHEASYIAPMFELIPILTLILGFIILGEVIQISQLWAMALIILGSIILSLELNGKDTKVNYKIILLMFGASLLYAVNAIIFKLIAVDQGFISSLFWDMLGKVMFGVLLFLGIKSFRVDFLKLLRQHKYFVIGLNVVNEIMGLIGMIALVYAVMFAPVVIVQTVGSLQTPFVFIIGIIITIFFPRFGKESTLLKHLVQKLIGIVLVTVGVYLLENL